MKVLKLIRTTLFWLFTAVFALYLAGCSQSTIAPENQTDDQFIQEVIIKGTGSNQQEPEDLMFNEVYDLDDGGAVGPGGDTPIDSLLRWGRKVTNVNVDVNITSGGDSLKIANIIRTVNGEFIIVGIVGGVQKTIVKPYTEVLKRTAVFKRIAYTPRPRFNWRLFKISMVDGETTAPQTGSEYVQMTKIEVYVNNALTRIFQGPDFTQNVFTVRRFNGAGMPEVHTGDQVRIKVYTHSKQSEPDIVAWHWARNTFGFHRIPFALTSQVPNGQYWDRTYEKTFNIYAQHRYGRFNGFISSSTYKSLYDDSPAEFASDLVGAPYRVLP